MAGIIHKEGRNTLIYSLLLLVFLNVFSFLLLENLYLQISITITSLLTYSFILHFFRNANRIPGRTGNSLLSPADGEIVAIEEVYEAEILKTKCIQLSIFMSAWNIHINWYPVSGKIVSYKYHPGKYLLARHPKSSILNERTSIAIETEESQIILLRQIAGFVARRVVCYAKTNNSVKAGRQMGFIKFGSRVDVFLPLGSNILVSKGDKVRGVESALALLKKS